MSRFSTGSGSVGLAASSSLDSGSPKNVGSAEIPNSLFFFRHSLDLVFTFFRGFLFSLFLISTEFRWYDACALVFPMVVSLGVNALSQTIDGQIGLFVSFDEWKCDFSLFREEDNFLVANRLNVYVFEIGSGEAGEVDPRGVFNVNGEH